MRTKSRALAICAAIVAGVMALFMGSVGIADAATVPVNFVYRGGDVKVGRAVMFTPTATFLPGSVTGTWDDVTGAFTGSLSLAPIDMTLSGFPFIATYSSTGVSGTVPTDASIGYQTLVFAGFNLNIKSIGGTTSCDVALGDVKADADINPLMPGTLPPGGLTFDIYTTSAGPAFTPTCQQSDIDQIGLSFPADIGIRLYLPSAKPAPTAPKIDAITPNSGSAAGGETVTITGTGFVDGATVTIGGSACTSVTRASATELSCTTPAGTVGAADVVVTNADSSTATLTGGYTYTAFGRDGGGAAALAAPSYTG